MTQAALPLVRDVVLVGGGHAHALLLRSWGMEPVAGTRLTLINPAPTAPYTGMLPGHIAGHYGRDALEIDLVRLARHAGARLTFGRVEGIDRQARRLHIAGRPPVAYDIASLDIGITSAMPDIPGFDAHAVAAKPLGPFAERWRDFVEADASRPVAVIGGGVAGVELALAMRHRMTAAGADPSIPVTVIEAATALTGLGDGTRRTILEALKASRIDLIEDAAIARIDAESVRLEDGREVPAHLVVGAAGARPFGWLEDTGLALTDGYVAVDEALRSVSDPAIYAVGDCAHLSHAPRPKAGVFAVRAAPVLTHNIRADLTGGARKSFRPQKHYLKLVSLGKKTALAEKWGHSIGGDWAWTWKDRIDRRFMDRLSDLPEMDPPPAPKYAAKSSDGPPAPLCGGCGAKVGGGALTRALAGVGSGARDDIETGSGDDAAVVRLGDRRLVISTDHLRAFWDDPYVMTRITVCHALGDVWAMGAEPQALLAQITLPRMGEAQQEAWLEEIVAATQDIAAATGAALVGGHTTMGAELTIGFTVTGLPAARPLTIDGAREGDSLLLTRPLGTGTLFAAEMRKKARGEDIRTALDLMAEPQGDIAARLALRAHAMTDVTGFGLAGHLARMADASDLSAEVDLAALPLYPGAEALAEAGIRSTIFEANRKDILADVPDTSRAALLFDPQTAGGLLAALAPDDATQAVKDLAVQGHEAWIIGDMKARGPVSLTAR
ncbi:selenide, water dikinase SelD [Alphaproteobacteria bacterium GH1-50]|uniref:Selenide, water dikinase SelD n=2 Tax=Kangsaoukella pontilimi TaxID=2691042 RepID=A0A7C9ME44_9RHOB|nr:selenide, water dikinase SelD [Kangsaoukella pontilimi]